MRLHFYKIAFEAFKPGSPRPRTRQATVHAPHVLESTFNPATRKALGGAVAHLVGQLATIQEVRGSIPSPGQVRFSLLLCVHPALNG
ncbi:hypothetical protein PoB_006679900 [Plakobranchus ocellatus]|uniref:Uncharacterized protein n=1 Tax=Plakobranchus ocellatus TaxID=259542 RepID=A0AAV4D7Y8_9GAST|nr:hypothetical protein PoB_006679900 [Plakobranchus ocellatus]